MNEDKLGSTSEAAGFGIALVCQEDIQNLIRRLETPPKFQELYDGVIALIPKTNNDQENLFRGL